MRFGDWGADRLGGGVGLLLFAAISALPQMAGPGYDSALAAGAIFPSACAIGTALFVANRSLGPLAALLRGLHVGLAVALIGALISLIFGVFVGLCDAREGLLLFGLGGGFGAIMGGVSGAVAGLLSRSLRAGPRRILSSIALALLGPVTGILLSLGRFYTSPMVFAYDPYFGYFSGPLYDTVIATLWPLVAYRVGSLGTLCAVFALAWLAESVPAGGSFRQALRRYPNVALGGTLAALLSLGVTAFGTELGHYASTRSVERALGRNVSVGRCDVVYSSALLAADAKRLGRECTAHLKQVEQFFDASGPERVRVLLFASDAEKGRWMGAARTYIAKPWRGEVYLQAAGFPHPVLGHELAHVVSASFGQGPFRIAGLLGGWLPDPGRIEGVASAASPDENNALTLDEWAAAMRRLGLLPRLESLFRLGFFGHNAASAYTAAGAFVRFVRADVGPAAVRKWYGGEAIERAAGMSLEALEGRWHRTLDTVKLSDAVLATARARFQRPAFFDRRCPRIIDRKLGEANARLASGDLLGAEEDFQSALSLDHRDSGARIGLAACRARGGDLARARDEYAKIHRAPDAAPWARLAAFEAAADVLLRQGRVDAAQAEYAELATHLADEDRLRTLDVKSLATTGIAREAIVSLLIGQELGPSWDLGAPKLGEWSALEPESGLSDYLLAKNLYNRGRFKEAGLYLDRSLGRRLPEPRVLDEALRLRVIIGCAELDRDAAHWALERLRMRKLPEARRQGLERLAERCTI